MKVYVLLERSGPVKRISGVFETLHAAIAAMDVPTPSAVMVTDAGPWQWGDYRIEEHEVQE